VQDDPLVVPDDELAGLLEQRVLGRRRGRLDGAGLEALDHLVVEAEEGQVELGDDDVLVVARVPDDGQPLRAPRQVEGEGRPHLQVPAGLHAAGVADDEERVVGRELVEVGLIGGSPAIHAVQVERGGAEVVERQRVDQHLLDGGGVEGDVVVDELAQVGVARGDVLVVTLGVRRVGVLHRPAELLQGRQRG
jgi:hypothetical protein